MRDSRVTGGQRRSRKKREGDRDRRDGEGEGATDARTQNEAEQKRVTGGETGKGRDGETEGRGRRGTQVREQRQVGVERETREKDSGVEGGSARSRYTEKDTGDQLQGTTQKMWK